jgi:hypothetical protein
MVGEMHGTNEPAMLLMVLADLLTKNGDSVCVGFEIPVEKMTAFSQKRTRQSLYETEFFSLASSDGRASKAWAAAIEKIGKNPMANIFFFDNIEGEIGTPGLSTKNSILFSTSQWADLRVTFHPILHRPT